METNYGCKVLKAPKGFMIEKTWELHSVTGKVKPGSVVYSVFTEDGSGLVDCFKTLEEARAACK